MSAIEELISLFCYVQILFIRPPEIRPLWSQTWVSSPRVSSLRCASVAITPKQAKTAGGVTGHAWTL